MPIRASTYLSLLTVGYVVGSGFAQQTIHVQTCGDDQWSGSMAICEAPDGAKATIQAAIEAASHGRVSEFNVGVIQT